MFNKILKAWKLLNNDIAIDMGSSTTRITVKGKDGIQLQEPSIVAVKNDSGRKTVVAVGEDAKKLIGRAPTDHELISPIKDGIIINDSIAEVMIKNFINKVSNTDVLRPNPRVFLAIPSSSTEVERRIFKEVLIDAGAREVLLIESTMAAAIGAGLPIESPKASMIVNIGANITEIGVLALKSHILSKTIKIGGHDLDEALINYIRRSDGVKIGLETAEKVKKHMATALESEALEENIMSVRGKYIQSGGVAAKLNINRKDVLLATAETFENIIAGIINVMEELPAEVVSDLYETGITLVGGSSNISGLDKMIEQFTGLKTTVKTEPSLCVINGLNIVLDMYGNNKKDL